MSWPKWWQEQQIGSLFGEVRALLFTIGVIAAATAKSTGVSFGTDVTITALGLITRGAWTITITGSWRLVIVSFFVSSRRRALAIDAFTSLRLDCCFLRAGVRTCPCDWTADFYATLLIMRPRSELRHGRFVGSSISAWNFCAGVRLLFSVNLPLPLAASDSCACFR